MTEQWRPRTESSSVEKLPTTNMQSYFYWFVVNSEAKQKTLFKFALARLAREHPNVDPRLVLLEFFADSIYRFEKHVKQLRKGQILCRKEEWEDL